MLANLVGIVLAGHESDRRGPATVYVVGLACFGAGVVLGGLAPSMGVLVAARAVQGLGGGALYNSAYVAIGRDPAEPGATLLANGASATQVRYAPSYLRVPELAEIEWAPPLLSQGVRLVIPLRIGDRLVGIYGLIAYTVSLRAREIGLRLALGARPADVDLMLIRGGLVLGVAGVGIGVALTTLLTGTLRSLLFGVAPRDAITLIGVGVLMLAATLVAAWIPALSVLSFP